MSVEELTNLMIKKPYMIIMGKGKLAKQYRTSEESIVEARRIAKLHLKKNKKIHKIPKILLFDLETSPMRAYVWERWKQNIGLNQTISEWFLLCWSAKWLFSNKVMSDCLTPDEVINENDSRIVEKLHELFDEADIIIAHNGDKFDIPKINSRFLLNGLNPPKPYIAIDTLKIAQKQFGFSSNKLDALAGYFNIPHKLETSFELWDKCMRGNKKALKYMEEYNRKDVEILEEVYLRLRPWIKSHPNINNYLDYEYPVCSNCGSEDLMEVEGKYYYTRVAKYQLFRCKDCGAVSRGRKNLNKTKSLVGISN